MWLFEGRIAELKIGGGVGEKRGGGDGVGEKGGS
jgi:hypothetical protein